MSRAKRGGKYADPKPRQRQTTITIVRKSRGGRESHRSHLYVRNATPSTEEGEPERDITSRNVTLPKLSFLQRKKIGGEWI